MHRPQDVAPIHGALRVTDTDVGDTLTARVVGTPTLTYSGWAIPPLADLTALTSPRALRFGDGTSNGGTTELDLTYNPGPVDVDFLRPGETLKVRYPIVVSDGTLVSPTQFLTFTIRGTEGRPTISSNYPAFDVFGSVVEDGGAPSAASISARASDVLSTTGPVPFRDSDRADTPEATVDTGAAVRTASGGLSLTPGQIDAFKAGFSISNPANGVWSYDISNARTQFLQVGDRIKIVYDVVVTDDFNRSVMQPVTIVIRGANDAPSILRSQGDEARYVEEIDASAQILRPTEGLLRVTDSMSAIR